MQLERTLVQVLIIIGKLEEPCMQTPRLKGSKRLKDRIRTVGTEKDEKPTYYLTASFARGTSRYHSPQLPLVNDEVLSVEF